MKKILAAAALPLAGAALAMTAPTAQAAPAVHVATTSPHAVRGYTGHPHAGVKLPAACFTSGTAICIDKHAHRLYWLRGGKLVDDLAVRTGRPGMETRSGHWKVEYKEKYSWSRPYQVWMPDAMYFSGGEAVHYSADFAANGYGVGSHGCANLRDRRAADVLFATTPVGSPVVVW